MSQNSSSSNNKDDRHAEKQITPRAEDFSEWYLDVVSAAELAENAPVRGCMIIKPNGYALWERIQKILDDRFKELGVANAYFPLLIPERFLEKEAEHVEGFSPELAVVTHAGGKDLEERLAVRPTSETIMYDAFSRWVRSYRDLPLLINQWSNVMRWELRPRLFLRTSEFLWQEGHTVHTTEEEADERARQMLQVYKDFAEDVMAVPVFIGQKSESEKFAGALHTYTVESVTQEGKALQFATSHNLGQNFSRAFEITYLGQDGARHYGWQTSWGISTRAIGGMVMTHSDDKGLVLPPRMAPQQVVITTVGHGMTNFDRVPSEALRLAEQLRGSGLRVHLDDRELRPGEKFFEWERKGVPLRLELGGKELSAQVLTAVRRDTGEKQEINLSQADTQVSELLDKIQTDMFRRAAEYKENWTKEVDSWEEFVKEIQAGHLVLAHWNGKADVEEKIKDETGASTRCAPFDHPAEKGKCIYSGEPSSCRFLFAKAY